MSCSRDKINYLNTYKNCVNQNINSEDYIREINTFINYAVYKKQEELRDRYNRLLLMIEVKEKIESLKCENQKQILINRYLHFMKWEDISEKMGYSLQHIHRLHNKALEEFKM